MGDLFEDIPAFPILGVQVLSKNPNSPMQAFADMRHVMYVVMCLL